MNNSPIKGRRDVIEGLAQLVKQAAAAEELPAELSLKLVRGFARGTRMLERGDLSDLDPQLEQTLSFVVVDLRALVMASKPAIAASIHTPNLLPTKTLTETLQSLLHDPQPDPPGARRYLQLRDDLELLRDGLNSLDLIHEELQTCLALADEQYFQNLASFECTSVYADRFMACFGVDPDPDGSFGFWAAAADTPAAEAEAWRAGSLLSRAGPDAEQITARLTEAARAQGAPPRYLQQKLGKPTAEEAAMATRVVATLALAVALRRHSGAISTRAATAGELEALPDPTRAQLLGTIPDLGLELRAQQEPGEVRLILYFPDLKNLEDINSARVPSWEMFPRGAVGRVAISAAEPLAPPAPPATSAPPAPRDDQIQITAVYNSEDVEFVITLDEKERDG